MILKSGFNILVQSDDYTHSGEQLHVLNPNSCDLELYCSIIEHFTVQNWGGTYHTYDEVAELLNTLVHRQSVLTKKTKDWLTNISADDVFDILMTFIGYDYTEATEDSDDDLVYFRKVLNWEVYFFDSECTNISEQVKIGEIVPSPQEAYDDDIIFEIIDFSENEQKDVL